jgi:hypothetical protein
LRRRSGTSWHPPAFGHGRCRNLIYTVLRVGARGGSELSVSACGAGVRGGGAGRKEALPDGRGSERRGSERRGACCRAAPTGSPWATWATGRTQASSQTGTPGRGKRRGSGRRR